MNHANDGYEQLITNFVTWAEQEANIRAAIVVGSRARTNRPADQWADLDLIVIAQNAQPLAADERWIAQIGEPVFTFVEMTPSGDPERRVLFGGGPCGLDVDFSIIPLDKMKGLPTAAHLGPELAAELFNVFGRGMRVLLDKDQLTKPLQALLAPMQSPATPAPSPAAYAAVVSDFWYHALWTAKHLRRGELWWAKAGCDLRLKQLLLTMLEWQARFAADAKRDTWFRGRFLETWADPRALDELSQAFAHYDEADLWRALLATMQLFRWLALETAHCLGYTYPTQSDGYVTQLVEQLSQPVNDLGWRL